MTAITTTERRDTPSSALTYRSPGGRRFELVLQMPNSLHACWHARKISQIYVLSCFDIFKCRELDRTGTDVYTLQGGTNRLSRYKLLLHWPCPFGFTIACRLRFATFCESHGFPPCAVVFFGPHFFEDCRNWFAFTFPSSFFWTV